MAKEKKSIEWDLVERDWRAGIKSKALMATQYGVSRTAMDKHFAKRGIARDLDNKVRAAAATIVAKSIVAPTPAAPLAPATEREIVEANATMQSQIILRHRSDIQRSSALSMKLLTELEQQTDHQDLIEQLIDALHNPDDKGMARRIEMLEKLTSLGSRASTMKTLADSLRTLVAMERQAFGLDEKEDDDVNTGIEEVIRRVQAKNGGD
jgi:hypothetical protein